MSRFSLIFQLRHRLSHPEVLEGASELLQAAAGRPGGGKEGLRIRQEPLQLLQAAPVEMPVLHQPLHQGAPLVRPLHRPLPVLPELGKLQDEVAPGYMNTVKCHSSSDIL